MSALSKLNKKRALSGLSLLCATVALNACVTQPPSFGGGIDFREARYNEISAMREYRECRDHALELDGEAQAKHDPAKYLASARMIEKCEAKLGPDVADIALDERMRAYALTVQNHLKGGDLESARENLDKFSANFQGRDLYFADGSSFVQTMEVLLGKRGAGAIGRYSDANVNNELKAELRRVRYWERN
ncbi:conserved exported hypothetical protein [Candidatus Terasakiella magnetica]|uniref:Lipoprotein n=1 Tax=Candidatus Terasakiella magnetica TaxID=1867952 RepID=A0A1C3RLV1_9PROT|nr:hypothetical protein [Candidatus Terasakiella magnetica]SCA58265.1 conserved exported hypothetical protein [Candidatus Terasakiella magnetica]